MRWWADLRFRWNALRHRRAMQSELDDEVAFHIEMEERKLLAEGMTADEARRLARLRFGGEERFKESAREAWGVTALMDLGSDLRHAARQLLARPAFSGLATLTLALGIGGTVALFSVVDGLLLRPLPFDAEEELRVFWSAYDWRGAEFDFVKERIEIFDGLTAYSSDGYTLRTEAGSSLQLATVASAELFDVLDARPLLGRTFEPNEDRPGAEPVVVLSHALWSQEFGADPEIVGRRIDLRGRPTTVIGVMPRAFYFPSPDHRLWAPLMLDPSSGDYEDNGWLVLTGRVRDGATDAQVEAEVGRIASALGERWTYPDAWDKTRDARVTPLRTYILGDFRPALLLLLGAVGILLLIACANVATLIVTRTSDRTGEMSIRAALGAGRARLARQILAETVLLGSIAGAVGLVLAAGAFGTLVASLPLTGGLGATLRLDWMALVACLVLAVGTGALVSLAPMHGLLRGRLEEGVFTSRTAGPARTRSRLQTGLVFGEVLLAVVLATGAVLLVRTVHALRAIEWGLDPEGVVAVDVMLPQDETDTGERRAFYDALVERTSVLPGVVAAGMINRIPVRDAGWQATVSLPDRPDLSGDRRPNAYYRPVTAGTFAALGIELVEGRGIETTDTRETPSVAVVNESFARQMFGTESAVGRIIARNGFSATPIRIVGVARDVRVRDLVGEIPMVAYYPWAQTLADQTYGILVAKTALDAADLVGPIRRAVQEADPRAAVGRAETMDDVIRAAMAEPLRLRFFLSAFTVLGLVLGTVGVYGVVAQTVRRRKTEFGIRLALGAPPTRLVAEVVRGGVAPVAAGVVAGCLAAVAASELLAGFLFGVQPTDPASLLTASLLLLVAGALASAIPAARASATDPATALRAE